MHRNVIRHGLTGPGPRVSSSESPHPWRQTEKSAKPEQDGAKRSRQWWQRNIAGKGGCVMKMYGIGSNPGDDMDVCKCIVTLWHGGYSKQPSSRKSSLEVGDRWEAPDSPPRVFSRKIGVELS
ncbi:hypothetical protein TNCV_1658581 [Trichonephila clavipes]|nr:hypothetical protein TNCV_1658581 [Trichonephila clavipes]